MVGGGGLPHGASHSVMPWRIQKWRMAYQLTAIGASVGGKSFNLFGELGYGSLGIVRLGIGIMF